MAGLLAAPIPMLENLRGRKVARSLAIGYPGAAGVELPGETQCRFEQHDSGTIGCTGDLGVPGAEPKLNCSFPVIRSVLPLKCLSSLATIAESSVMPSSHT